MKIHSAVLTLALSVVCCSAYAQWQWVDKDGRKVFSDRAPLMDVPEKNILKRPSSANRVVASTANDGATGGKPEAEDGVPIPGGVDKELEAKRKKVLEAEAAKRQAEESRIAKIKVENCARALQTKANYDSGVRISRPNAAGELEVMDDAARATELRRLQLIIASECK
jgi:hypothetical protein